MSSNIILLVVLLAAHDSLSSDDTTATAIGIKDTPVNVSTTPDVPTTATAEPPTTSATTTALPTTANTTNSTTSPTTTAAMTTTARPTTTAPPFADYSLKDNETVCIRVRGYVSFQVPYTSNNTKVVATVVLPPLGTVAGYCFGKNSSAEIRISWDTPNCEFVLGFTLHTDGSWKTVSMNYTFNTTNVSFKSPDKIGVISGGLLKSSGADMYHAAKKKSYSCGREDTVLLTNDVRVKFSQFQMQPIPFNGADFYKADVCGASDDSVTNSIVPIAVGCALAGLIVIVLVAYLIGRRRANRGYQQV